MMTRNMMLSILAALGFAAAPVVTVAAPADGVVAVVDKEIVLLSELNEITHLTLAQEKQRAPDSAMFNEMRHKILGRIIDDRILLAKAKSETIEVAESEINQLVEEQVSALAKRYGTPDSLDKALKNEYGLSLSKLRRKYRKDIRDNLIKQRFREKLVHKASVTRDEVARFYTDYKDSLPTEEASVNLSHIMLKVAPSPDLEQKALDKIGRIQTRLAGEPFGKLAVEVSEDPTAKDSGDIGTFAKGELGLPEFEEAAFALKAKEVSRPIRTQLGYHLIQVVDRTERKVHVRQITVLVKPSDAEEKKITDRLDSLRATIKDSVGFANAADRVSQDENTKGSGGALGWYTLERLSPDYGNVIKELDEGEISRPVRIGDGFHLLRLNKKSDSRALTMADDYPVLERMALSQKVQTQMENQLRGWRKDFHVETMLDEFEK